MRTASFVEVCAPVASLDRHTAGCSAYRSCRITSRRTNGSVSCAVAVLAHSWPSTSACALRSRCTLATMAMSTSPRRSAAPSVFCRNRQTRVGGSSSCPDLSTLTRSSTYAPCHASSDGATTRVPTAPSPAHATTARRASSVAAVYVSGSTRPSQSGQSRCSSPSSRRPSRPGTKQQSTEPSRGWCNSAIEQLVDVCERSWSIRHRWSAGLWRSNLTEANARAKHDVLVTMMRFDETTRTIIDGRTFGFCKLVIDCRTHMLLGCHVVGERAVDIVQTAAIVMAGGMSVDSLARLPLSFPTYTGILGRAAAIAARRLNVGAAPDELTMLP